MDLSKRECHFANDQPWVKTTRTLSFVDETPDIINIHDSGTNLDSLHNFDVGVDIDADADAASQRSSPQALSLPPLTKQHSEPQSQRPVHSESPGARGGERPSKKRAFSYSTLTSCRQPPRSEPDDARTPSQDSSNAHDTDLFPRYLASPAPNHNILYQFAHDHASPEIKSPARAELSALGNDVAEAISGIYLEAPKWPLEDPLEAMLFHNYVVKLAPLFDLCDIDRHFATVVPRRATVCPPLMNAVLAASAK